MVDPVTPNALRLWVPLALALEAGWLCLLGWYGLRLLVAL